MFYLEIFFEALGSWSTNTSVDVLFLTTRKGINYKHMNKTKSPGDQKQLVPKRMKIMLKNPVRTMKLTYNIRAYVRLMDIIKLA